MRQPKFNPYTPHPADQEMREKMRALFSGWIRARNGQHYEYSFRFIPGMDQETGETTGLTFTASIVKAAPGESKKKVIRPPGV